MYNQTKYFLSESYQNPQYDSNDITNFTLTDALNAQMGIGIGRNGTTSSISYTCYAIQIVSNSVFNVLVDGTTKIVSSSGGLLTSLSQSAQAILYGNFTTASVSSGLICGYYR